MKNYLLFIAIGLIIFTASFNAYKAYSVLPKETEMLTAIQLRLQNDSPILLIEKSSLFDTDITVVLFEQEERNSFALFKSNRLNDKLKLSLVQPTIQEDQRMLFKTNNGNYIIFTSPLFEPIHSISFTNRSKKKYSFYVKPITPSSKNIYITKNTVPRNLHDSMLENMQFFSENGASITN
ncbi:MAG: hypothetical protein ABS944_17895 [Solibacillus sp.]|uniref:hypothetical protein n=1 Tax=unclassified Solibacillus TaxID=2637870 RepID=UPI0030F69CC4